MVYRGLLFVAFVFRASGTHLAQPDYSSLAQCAASWYTYESLTSAAVTVIESTSTTYSSVTTDLTYGTGSVYTTSAGIPVASGTFTPTKIIQSVFNVPSWDIIPSRSTRDLSQTPFPPSCSSPSPSDCSQLYVSYMSSLGLSANASVPKITPAPRNSPQCPDYYYKPFSTCSYFTQDVETCFLSGANVKVFYFPSQTLQSPAGTITKQVIQSFAPGIIFTSPSIYLSFDYLSGISTLAAQQSICTSCGWNGCQARGVGGGNGLLSRGTSIVGALLTMAPEEVSTLIVQFPPDQVTSIINVIAHGLSDFAYYADDINYVANFTAGRLNLDHFTHPPPKNYYLRPEGAPGCNGSVPSPMCSTIFEGMHRPILSLPSQVSLLQGEWATCQPAIYGVYDPPQALTEVSTIEGVPGYTVSAFPTQALTTPGRSTSHGQTAYPPGELPFQVSSTSSPSEVSSTSSPAEVSSTSSSAAVQNQSASEAIAAPSSPPTNAGKSLTSGPLEGPMAALIIAMIGVMVLL